MTGVVLSYIEAPAISVLHKCALYIYECCFHCRSLKCWEVDETLLFGGKDNDHCLNGLNICCLKCPLRLCGQQDIRG